MSGHPECISVSQSSMRGGLSLPFSGPVVLRAAPNGRMAQAKSGFAACVSEGPRASHLLEHHVVW